MPKFEKGHPKYGGRKKGTPVSVIRRDVAAKLSELGFDPIIRLVEIVRAADCPVDTQARICSELAKYLHPQLRSTELVGSGGGPVEVSFDAKLLLESRLAALGARLRESGDGRAAA